MQLLIVVQVIFVKVNMNYHRHELFNQKKKINSVFGLNQLNITTPPPPKKNNF